MRGRRVKEGESNNIIMVILFIIIMVGIIGFLIYYSPKQPQVAKNEVNTTNTISNQTKNETNLENKTTENIAKPEENTIIKETVDNQPKVIGKEEEESKKEEKGKTDSERALELAKKEWGDDVESVKFVIDKVDGSKYRIAVRDINTTAAIVWYTVDIDAGTVE